MHHYRDKEGQVGREGGGGRRRGGGGRGRRGGGGRRWEEGGGGRRGGGRKEGWGCISHYLSLAFCQSVKFSSSRAKNTPDTASKLG